MADQNESKNKKLSNMMADDIDRSAIMSELERIHGRHFRETARYSDLQSGIKEKGQWLNQLLEEGRRTPEFKTSPFYAEQVPALKQEIQKTRGKLNTIEQHASQRSESEASTFIARQFHPSAISGQAATLQKMDKVQNKAFSMANQSYEELEAERHEVMAQIRVREREAQNEIKGAFSKKQVDPEKSAAIGAMVGGTSDHIEKLAMINAAQTFQKASGKDPNTRMRSLAEMGQVAETMLSAEDVAKEVREGGVAIKKGDEAVNIKAKDIDKQLLTEAATLAKALQELSSGVHTTEEKLSELRSTAEESAENMKKLQEAQKAAGGGNNWNAANVAMGLAGGFGAIGSAAQQIMVNQRMQQVSNIGGFANIANEQYDMYQKARGGDVASQLLLTQTDEAADFGVEMKRGTQLAQGAFAAAGVAQTAAGAIQMAEGGAQKFNPGAYLAGASTNNTNAIISGAQNTVQGLATTATVGTDMLRGTSANAAQIQGQQQQMEARRALQAVSANQLQGLRNFYTDLDVAGQSMGGKASAFIEQAGSEENFARMSDARLSPEQFAKLAGQGAQQIGSTFQSDQIFAARNLERRGFGSSQENMQRMAALAGAGANNPQEGMEVVLSAAVTKGLDSSKSINMMVENTAALSATSAGAAVGVDTTAAVSSMLAAGMNTNMANKEFALQQAMSAAEITKAATTDRSVSFTGMANTAGLQSNLERQGINIGGLEALSVQGVDIATLKSLQGDPKKAAEFFQNKGVNLQEGQADKFLETVLVEKERQTLRQGGLATGYNLEDLREKVRSGKAEKGTDEFRQLGQIAELQGRTGGAEELIRELRGIKAPNVDAGIGKDLTSKPGDDVKKQMDDLRTSGFKQLTEAAQLASTQLGGFTKAVDSFTKLQQEFEKGGTQNEKEFSEAAGKMATEFSTVAKQFNEATTTYATASKEMIAAAKALASNRNPVMPQAVSDAMDKMKGSTRGK